MKDFKQSIDPERGFTKSESGSMTTLSLYLLIPILMLAGYAIDTSNAVASGEQLQSAADTAAHAALLRRELLSEDVAKAAALDMAERNMPGAKYGYIIDSSDIEFGNWDPDAFTFTPQSGSRHAVRVTARRTKENQNELRTYLFGLVGMDNWNLTREAVFTTYQPSCLKEGFVAESVVDLQSNNSFVNGFCIHSNAHVSLNSNNYFEPGTVVSMANIDDLELPNSGFKTNVGLQDALHEGSWNIRIIDRIAPLIEGLRTFDPAYRPAYITSTVATTLTSKTLGPAELLPGRLYLVSCNGGPALSINNNAILSRVVLVTNCEVKFGQGVTLEDVVIATTSTSNQSFTAASGLQIGKDDDCAVGGGAQLVTMGSMKFASDISVYNGQLLALGDINFTANAVGIKGAAFVAGGEISGTSNMSMGFCGTGMEANFEAEYFKLVQ